MSTPLFDPEDPRLTAYALGETLDPADRTEVEQILQQSPEARAAMKDIQGLTTSLTAEYEQERLAATAELPPNVIRLPTAATDSQWSWLRPLLAAAAILLAIAALAFLNPTVRSYRSRKSVVAAPTISDRPAAATVTQIEPAPTIAEPGQEVMQPKDSPGPLLADNLDLSPSLNGAGTHSSPSGVGTASGVSPQTPPSIALAQTVQSPDFKFETFGVRPGVMSSESVASGSQLADARLTTRRPLPADARKEERQMLAFDRPRRDHDLNGSLADADTSKAAPAAAPVGRTIATDEEADHDGLRRQTRLLKVAPGFNTATYDHLTENPFLAAKENPLSTFSLDVDTASYANVRRFIESGSLPPPDAVRIEELINYFPYDYAPPAPDSGQAFAVHLEAASCPWAPLHRLVRIGIKGREVATDKRPASNLVFLIDVSGSMEPPERLPLIKRAMSMMVEHLTGKDRMAIVTYAGNSGLVLPSTSGDHKDAILNALDHLEAGGGTNGASGITLAYKVAGKNFVKGGTNRVILATDGDFNVGVTSQGDLIRLIQDEARSGVFLSALGVGTDNYKDSTMQKLADKGNGNYNYIDRLEEARKVLVEQMSGTLLTIAKDVKIQVEFNPAVAASYRLIGYEKRMLREEDFNDDRIDAGEIGAGHSVTALYEVVPVGQPTPGAAPAVDPLRYGPPTPDVRPTGSPILDDSKRIVPSPEMLTVKMRHKAPDAEQSEKSYEEALVDQGSPGDFAHASVDFKFAAAVADFGLSLRDSPYKGNATLGAAVELAQDGKGTDAKGYRAGFIELVHRAQALKDAPGEGTAPVR